MKLARLHGSLAWGLPAGAVVLLVGGALGRLSAAERAARRVQTEVDLRQEALAASAAWPRSETGEATAALERCRSLATTSALRMAALGEAARSAGVTLVSLESLADAPGPIPDIVRAAHRVESEGSLEQVARFLAALQTAPGLVVLEELELQPVGGEGGATVRAVLCVAWLAPAPAVAPVEEEEPR